MNGIYDIGPQAGKRLKVGDEILGVPRENGSPKQVTPLFRFPAFSVEEITDKTTKIRSLM